MFQTLLAIAVLIFALLMLSTHRRSWQRSKALPMRPEDRHFLQLRFQRRAQASALLTAIAVAIFIAKWVSPERDPRFYVALWVGIAFTTLWVVWLAVIDALAVSRHFRELQRVRRTTEARLREEARRQANPSATPVDPPLDGH